MGIFDVFTGDPAKEAAAKNAALLQSNQAAGTGILQGNQAYGTGVLQNNQAAGLAALQNNQAAGTGFLQNNQNAGLTALQANQAAGTSALQGGQTGALDALSNSGAFYAPLAAKYGAGSNLYLDSLGVNGAGGNARATDAFQAGPGYRYAVDQSLEGINRSAAARGGAFGGNTLAALSDRAGNMANQEYGNWQSRLAGLIPSEQAAISGMAGAEANKAGIYRGTGQDIASLGTNTANGIVGLGNATAQGLTNLGTNTANSITGLGTATAGGLTNLGTNTANNIVNLGTNTATGVANQNTQAANAEMAGSGNLWGLGLNLAKLGVGAATGGTSLLGGLGGGTAGVMNVGGQQYPAFR